MPLLTFVSTETKFTDRPLTFHKRKGLKGLYLCEGVDRWPKIDRWGIPSHTHQSLKLGDHKGLTLFFHGWHPWGIRPILLPLVLICIFLNPVPVCFWVQYSTSQCLPFSTSGARHHGTQLCYCHRGNSVLVLYIFHYFIIISDSIHCYCFIRPVLIFQPIIYFPFSSFTFSCGGEWLTESICHSA